MPYFVVASLLVFVIAGVCPVIFVRGIEATVHSADDDVLSFLGGATSAIPSLPRWTCSDPSRT
jgi:hypothetical protein